MLHSIFSTSFLAGCALAASLACSSAGAPNVREPPTALPASAADPVALEPVADEPVPRTVRPGPMQSLEQLLTAQALLVSLLLTPLSKDGAEQLDARATAPQGRAPEAEARAPGDSNVR
jgi:hypothetical protein